MKNLKYLNKIMSLLVAAIFIATANVYPAQDTLRIPIDKHVLTRAKKKIDTSFQKSEYIIMIDADKSILYGDNDDAARLNLTKLRKGYYVSPIIDQVCNMEPEEILIKYDNKKNVIMVWKMIEVEDDMLYKENLYELGKPLKVIKISKDQEVDTGQFRMKISVAKEGKACNLKHVFIYTKSIAAYAGLVCPVTTFELKPIAAEDIAILTKRNIGEPRIFIEKEEKKLDRIENMPWDGLNRISNAYLNALRYFTEKDSVFTSYAVDRLIGFSQTYSKYSTGIGGKHFRYPHSRETLVKMYQNFPEPFLLLKNRRGYKHRQEVLEIIRIANACDRSGMDYALLEEDPYFWLSIGMVLDKVSKECSFNNDPTRKDITNMIKFIRYRLEFKETYKQLKDSHVDHLNNILSRCSDRTNLKQFCPDISRLIRKFKTIIASNEQHSESIKSLPKTVSSVEKVHKRLVSLGKYLDNYHHEKGNHDTKLKHMIKVLKIIIHSANGYDRIYESAFIPKDIRNILEEDKDILLWKFSKAFGEIGGQVTDYNEYGPKVKEITALRMELYKILTNDALLRQIVDPSDIGNDRAEISNLSHDILLERLNKMPEGERIKFVIKIIKDIDNFRTHNGRGGAVFPERARDLLYHIDITSRSRKLMRVLNQQLNWEDGFFYDAAKHIKAVIMQSNGRAGDIARTKGTETTL